MPQVPQRQQQTLARQAEVQGIGYLTGVDVRLRFLPAPPGSGIRFTRIDLPDRPSVPAHVRHVIPRERRTTLQQGNATVEMVEHVLAALSGLQIDNCLIEINAPETPGCDGSSQAFVEALEQAGIASQNQPRTRCTITQPITVTQGAAQITALPNPSQHLLLSYQLDFGSDHPIGTQSHFLEITPGRFRDELAPCRTFLLESEANALRAAGIGARTTVSDLLIFNQSGPINNHLRFPNECARHKMLDLLGDLSLLGHDLLGHVVAHRSGHALNAELVRKLIEQMEKSADPIAEATPFDIQQVMEILPHRSPFLLIDRVLELDSRKRCRALKNITINEPFFQGHLPGRPLMPGVMILEAMAQTAGVLIGEQVDFRRTFAVIAGIDEVRFRCPVVPGDQLIIEAESLRSRSRTFDIRAHATAGDHIAAQARFKFMLVDLDQVGRMSNPIAAVA
jgi:UDP-3-O-[3-hydroxymyristoyl] N-acetylglucosamine deacetylase/3-hydroxyacyl-[acyl-carrier-protein] dehydratase